MIGTTNTKINWRLACYLFGVALVGLSTPALAEETRPLGNLNAAGDWKLEQWNKAQGRFAVRPEFPAEVKTADDKQRASLGVKISWPGGEDFRFFSILPSGASDPIPFKATEVRVWVKGSGTEHALEIHFADADDKDVKVGMGTMAIEDWHQVKSPIPASWKQPLSLKSVTWHNWSARQAIDTTAYLAGLEVVVDPAQKWAIATGEARAVSDLNLPGEWKASQWNKATGVVSIADDFPAELKTYAGAPRKSLKADMSFTAFTGGDTFKFFTVEPAKSAPVPLKLLEVRFWMKGAQKPHTIEMQFTDKEGKSVKVSPAPGNVNFEGWKQVRAKVPASWAQPVTFKGITIQNWDVKESADFSVLMTRLEFVVDAAQPMVKEKSATNDNW